MTMKRVFFGALVLAFALPAAAEPKFRDKNQSPVEPGAGSWRTWAISSGKDYRVPPPPGPADTRAELRRMNDLIAAADADDAQQITFWDAGSPEYRWIDLISQRILAGTPTTTYPHRVYTYVAMAMYDATIAAWESKYYYRRARPSELDHKLPTAVDVPDSPSYPSEHAAAAQAAASVLAFFLPAEAGNFQDLADKAGRSRVLAGVQYPSDVDAGAELGRLVAARVIAKSQSDGSDGSATPPRLNGPCNWVGMNPSNITAALWHPLLLSSPGQFRPPTPPDCTGTDVQNQKMYVSNFVRTSFTPADFLRNSKAFYWQMPEGLQTWPYKYANTFMAEDRLDKNPPRAARAYALIAATQFDAFIASQDGKFTYWYIRPPQLCSYGACDPTTHPAEPTSGIVPLFSIPPFPSYPSNHSTFSASRSEILAYLFPTRATAMRALAEEAGTSRLWAGIHYQMDNQSGLALGRSVAGVFIAWAETDGSQTP
jgi:membrane-associated phospholipid phosphatase